MFLKKLKVFRKSAHGCKTTQHSGMSFMQSFTSVQKSGNELICRGDRLAFPIRDGIPVMLEDEARILMADEEV